MHSPPLMTFVTRSTLVHQGLFPLRLTSQL